MSSKNKENQTNSKHKNYRVEAPGQPPTTVSLSKRTNWTANALKQAGMRGLTQLDMNGGVLREYVYRLRKCGVPVDAEVEKHTGEFAGLHRRYTLGCELFPVTEGVAV